MNCIPIGCFALAELSVAKSSSRNSKNACSWLSWSARWRKISWRRSQRTCLQPSFSVNQCGSTDPNQPTRASTSSTAPSPWPPPRLTTTPSTCLPPPPPPPLQLQLLRRSNSLRCRLLRQRCFSGPMMMPSTTPVSPPPPPMPTPRSTSFLTRTSSARSQRLNFTFNFSMGFKSWSNQLWNNCVILHQLD